MPISRTGYRPYKASGLIKFEDLSLHIFSTLPHVYIKKQKNNIFLDDAIFGVKYKALQLKLKKHKKTSSLLFLKFYHGPKT